MLRSYFGRNQNANISHKHATALNRIIDTFNQAPNVNLRLPRVRIEEETQWFEDACA
jgi:hypothetical protein